MFGWNYWQNKGKEKPAGNIIFKILDDENSLVNFEYVELSQEASNQFEQKLKEAEENLAKGGGNEFMMVNYNNAALYKSYLGDYRAAYGYYLESLNLFKDLRITWLALGDLLIKMKAYQSAEAAYRKAVRLNPYDSLNYIKLADLYKITGQIEKISATFKDGLESTAKNVEGNTLLLTEYAKWLVEIKSYDQAILLYEQLKEKQPGNADSLDKAIEKLKKMKEGQQDEVI